MTKTNSQSQRTWIPSLCCVSDFFLDIVGQCELLFLVIQTFSAFKLLMDIVKE